jgi:RNA polymerase sigma factor (sigma-70 family)
MTTPYDRQITPCTEGLSLRCSFCNKGPATIGDLIERPAWPGCIPAYICADCVELCAYLLEQRRTLAGGEQKPDQSEINAATPKMLEEKIKQTLSVLTSLESDVIKLRYGLGDGYTYTFAEVAGQLGITAERVAEIEKQAIEKIRSFSRAKGV